MPKLETFRCARALCAGNQPMHMIRKSQLDVHEGQTPCAVSQIYPLAFLSGFRLSSSLRLVPLL